MTFYYFVNVTRNLDDIAGKTNIKNVGIMSLFEAIISANGWNSNDSIMAFPETDEEYDHPVMRYVNGDFEFKFKCDECDSIDEDSCGCNPNNSEIDTEIDCDEEPVDNCTYCGDILRNHAYGNICGKHVPSYALWETDVNDKDSNYSAFYEELSERKLAIELDEYDCGQDDIEDDRYNYENDRYDYDQGFGYEDECFEESCY